MELSQTINGIETKVSKTAVNNENIFGLRPILRYLFKSVFANNANIKAGSIKTPISLIICSNFTKLMLVLLMLSFPQIAIATAIPSKLNINKQIMIITIKLISFRYGGKFIKKGSFFSIIFI